MSKTSDDDNTTLNRYSSVITARVEKMQCSLVDPYNYVEVSVNSLPINLNGAQK